MNITKKKLRYCFLTKYKNNSKKKPNKIISHFNFSNKYHSNYYKNLNKTFCKNFNNNDKALDKKPLTKIDNKFLKNILEKDEKERNDKTSQCDLDVLIDFDRDKSNDSIINSSKSFTLSSNNVKNSVKFIVNKFNHNKSATTLFFKKAKKMELNSLSNITDSSLGLLLDEENKNDFTEYDKDKSLPSKMIDLFNYRAHKYLNTSKSLKMFSSKTDRFREEMINSFKNIENPKEIIKKLKKKYNESVDIFDRQKDLKMQKAIQDEQSFYKLKHEDNIKNINLIYKKLLFLSKNRSEDRKLTYFPKGKSSRKSLNIKQNLLNLLPLKKKKRKTVIETKFLFNNNDTSRDKSKENNSNFSSSLELTNLQQNSKIKNYKKINKCKNEEKVEKALLKYEKYKKNKIRLNAKKFRDIIGEMINSSYRLKNSTYLDNESKKIRIINNNLMKISKMKKINKSIDKYGDEFKEDYFRLKEKMNKCENEYYRVSVFNNKYNLSFLKPTLKQSTIKKYIQMNNYAFGFPC